MVYGQQVADQNKMKRSMQRQPIYNKPINVMKVEKPSAQQLFHKHLRGLTTYEQRVKYGIGEDISSEHNRFSRPNLDGLRIDQFKQKDKQIPLIGQPLVYDPFESKGSFTMMQKQ